MDPYTPPNDPVRILHRDAQILIVDKPPGLLSVPGKGEGLSDCLIERIRADIPEVLLVHRLDRDTSGVMVFALTSRAQRHLGLQFEKRQMSKVYVARVWGRVEGEAGTVDLPIIVDWPNRPLQKIDHETGRPARTDWKLVRREALESRLRLFPHSGRSHQLRLHMKEIGHPILGDPLYADGPARDFPRLMLHAEGLKFRHPDGGAWMKFTVPCPF